MGVGRDVSGALVLQRSAARIAVLPLGGCESEEVSENPFPDDGSNPFPMDGGIDATPPPDAFGNPFDDAAPDDAVVEADDAAPQG